MARRPKKSSTKLSVNMAGVEARVTVPEGDYRVEVEEISREEGKNSDYLKWTLKIVGGKFDGKKVYNNTSLAPQALWNLANFLTAIGEEVPDGEMELDLKELVGKECMVVVQHEDYEGKPQAKVADYYPVDGDAESSDDDEEDEDEKPAKGKKSKAKSKDDDEDDDEEEEDEKPAKRGRGRPKKAAKEEEADDDEDEEEEEKPAKRGRGRPKKSAKDDDEDEDEEDEKVSKRGKGKSKKVVITAEQVDDMDEDELGDLIEKHDLDVDLDDYKTLRKKIAAVKEALEENDLLHDA